MNDFKNKIVGYGEEAPDQLLANPSNHRIHPYAQQNALKGVLDQVGWIDDVIINKRTGHIVDGHLRVHVALSNDQSTVPVKYIDVDEEHEKLLLASFDHITNMAMVDSQKLDDLLRELPAVESPDLMEALDDLAKSVGLYGGNEAQDGNGSGDGQGGNSLVCQHCGMEVENV